MKNSKMTAVMLKGEAIERPALPQATYGSIWHAPGSHSGINVCALMGALPLARRVCVVALKKRTMRRFKDFVHQENKKQNKTNPLLFVSSEHSWSQGVGIALHIWHCPALPGIQEGGRQACFQRLEHIFLIISPKHRCWYGGSSGADPYEHARAQQMGIPSQLLGEQGT